MTLDPAATVPIGRTGVAVPRMCIGAGTLSNADGPAALGATLEVAWDRGLRHVDTAPLYLDGGSERLVGRFLARHQRDHVVVSTKTGRQPDARHGAGDAQRRFDYSRDATLRSIEESLTRLGTDYLDIAIIHDVDREMHPDFPESYRTATIEAYPALAELKDSGVVHAIGVSTRQADVALRALRDIEPDCLMMAGAYTLLNHDPLADLLPECESRGIPVLIASPFNSGILASGDPASTFGYGPASPEVARRVRALVRICSRHGVTLASAALQFPLAHPAIASVVVGNRSVAEFESNARGLGERIPAEFWAELKEEGLIPPQAPVPLETDDRRPDAV